MAPTTETDEPHPPARDRLDVTPPEDDVLRTASALGEEAGLTPISASTGAALRLLAAATSAHAAIEVGTGTGVAALWLLRGMRPDGVLTTIDIDGAHQRVARRVFTEAGIPS